MAPNRQIVRSYESLISFSTRLLDVVAVSIGAAGAYLWRFSELPASIPVQYGVLVLVGTLLSLVIFPAFGVYQSWRGRSLYRLVSRLFFAWASVILILLAFIFVAKHGEVYSRLWLGYWWFLMLAGLLLVRLSVYRFLRFLRRRGWNHKRVVVAGAGQLGREVVRRLHTMQSIGFDVVAYVDDNTRLHGKRFGGALVVGDLSSIAQTIESFGAHELWIALPLKAEEQVRKILHSLRHSTVNVRFIPDIFGFRLLNHSVSEIGGMPVLDLNVSPMSGINQFVKAAEDRCLALVILTLVSPLLAAIAIGVKLSSPGPIIFKQLRHGWDGKPIRVYKFRTMQVHTEEGQVTQATKGDSRITNFGAFLRRTSLDELPQFFNVLQGRMSIVGPRPHALAHNELYKDQVDDYMLRHKVKPGITGWAQVNGWRGETDTLDKMKKRVEYDLYYIEHWSLWFDIKIIILTFFRGFVHNNAY